MRFARTMAMLEAAPELGLGAPTIAWVDTAMRAMKLFADPAYAATIRQPILMVAAGNDEVVSTPAIETFGMNLLAGRHLILAGSRHEISAGAGSLPRPVLGGVRRLRAGHAAVLGPVSY